MATTDDRVGTRVRPLLILGSRIFAAEVADLASETPGCEVAGFVENLEPERCREQLEGLPIFWIDALSGLASSHAAVCAIGSTQRSRFVEQAASYGIPFTTLIHPSARVSPKSAVGEGTIVSAGALIAAHTHLGRHVIINRGALIGHHTTIGDYVTIGPGSNIAGKVVVGSKTYIGMGAVVIDRVSIGTHCVVGAAAVVTKDVPDHTFVAGMPARAVKRDIEGK